jgi:hypothetical protein
MNESTQRAKLIKEEQSLIALIASYQDEIDDYSIDLAHAQRLLKEHDEGLNDNPWQDYKVLIHADPED